MKIPINSKNALPRALRRAYMALHRRSEAQFAPYGVTADQFVLLVTLAGGQALTQRELARRMPSDPSTVRAMLVLLEKRGLVKRGTRPADARARTVTLATAGELMLRQLWVAGETIRAQMVASLRPDETASLVRLLTRVAEALNGESTPLGDQPPITRERMKI